MDAPVQKFDRTMPVYAGGSKPAARRGAGGAAQKVSSGGMDMAYMVGAGGMEGMSAVDRAKAGCGRGKRPYEYKCFMKGESTSFAGGKPSFTKTDKMADRIVNARGNVVGKKTFDNAVKVFEWMG